MAVDRSVKCAHQACKCPPIKEMENQYCSDHCRNEPADSEGTGCRCGHAECDLSKTDKETKPFEPA
jgi:hypothetical protein